MCNITDKLKLMCDINDPQDQKILLAVELMNDKFTRMNEIINNKFKHVEGTQRETNKTLHALVNSIDEIKKSVSDHKSCPVYNNKEAAEKLIFFAKYPKITTITIISSIIIILYELYKLIIK